VFPHVVLMDIRMPVLDGLEATRLICADPTLVRTRVLVMTTFDVDQYVYGALRAGAERLPAQGHPPARAGAGNRSHRCR
jgi:DNA-binding NarL/FixJ family response regulator